MGEPLAYFITFHTYGSWLHGRAEGSVDRKHNQPGTPFLPADPEAHQFKREIMGRPAVLLTDEARRIGCSTIVDVCAWRSWTLHAVHVRTNHVHVVVNASDRAEKVMGDLKAWCTRRLRDATLVDPDSPLWSRHGSTIYLWDARGVEQKVHYTLDQQGAVLPGSRYPDKPTPIDIIPSRDA